MNELWATALIYLLLFSLDLRSSGQNGFLVPQPKLCWRAFFLALSLCLEKPSLGYLFNYSLLRLLSLTSIKNMTFSSPVPILLPSTHHHSTPYASACTSNALHLPLQRQLHRNRDSAGCMHGCPPMIWKSVWRIGGAQWIYWKNVTNSKEWINAWMCDH